MEWEKRMISTKDMFYAQDEEQVWIIKPVQPPKDEPKPPPAPPTHDELLYGKFYPFYHKPFVGPAAPPKPKPKTRKVALWVSVCCGDCEDLARAAVVGAVGAVKDKDVEFVRWKSKMTVEVPNTTGTTPSFEDEIVLACRTTFSEARLWTTDDDI